MAGVSTPLTYILGVSTKPVLTRRPGRVSSLLMALLGAAAGILLSELGLWAMRLRFSDLAFYSPWWARWLALTIAMATSVLFAWGPARRAAALQPVNALQGRRTDA